MEKLVSGSRLDENPINQKKGTWRFARNITVYKKFTDVTNEPGVDDITPTNLTPVYTAFPTKPVIGSIILNEEKIFFFGTNNPADSEIGIIDIASTTHRYRTILKGAWLNFNSSFPIQGTFEKKFNNNLVIAWTDFYNPFKVLNVDCIPFTVNSNGTVPIGEQDKALNLLQLFPNYITPIINPDNLEVRDGQGNLLTGVYYPTISYELNDGGVTSWGKIYNGVPIYTDNQTLAFDKVGGNIGGEPTAKNIWMKFENVDTNYKFLKLGYLYVKNGVTSAWEVNKFPITGSTLECNIFGTENTLKEITVDEVIIPNAIYPRGKTITNLQRQLYLGNVEQDPEINWQTYANQVQVKWIRERDISLYGDVKNTKSGGVVTKYGSYKDAAVVFFDKEWKSGEVAALYISLKLKNGLWTRAFHVPGRDVIIGDEVILNPTSIPSDLNDLDGGNPIYKYQIHDTTQSNGTMGFWKNENEEYPLDPNNPSAVHPDYANIPGVTTINRKVRHHVFPDLRALKGYGRNFVTNQPATLGKTMTIYTQDLANPSLEEYYLHFDGVAASSGVGFNHSVPVTGITRFDGFASPGVFTMGVDWHKDFSSNDGGTNFSSGFDLSGGSGSYNPHWNLTFEIRKNGTPILYYYADVGGKPAYLIFSSSFPDLNNSVSGINISVVPGDQVDVYYQLLTPGTKPSALPDNTNPGDVGGVNLDWGARLDVSFGAGNLSTQPLGIEVSNVNIPASILDQVDSWEVFYAKRTSNNIRIIGQDMVKSGRFHAFDLMTTKALSQASYLKPLLNYSLGTGVELLDTVRTGPNETQYPTQKIEYISQFLYLGENVSLPINNSNLSEDIYIVGGHAKTDASYITSTYGANNTLLDICVYRRNMYFPFQEQELISTGLNVKINGSGVQPTVKLYGGDTYITSYGFRASTTVNNSYHLACESASNIHLRYEDIILSKYYFPKGTTPTPSWYGYNRDYNCINDFNQIDIHYGGDGCLDETITRFPQRVVRSITDGSESKFLNWRVFKANDYYEMPKNRGVIWNILGDNKTLYIHHEYSLFIAEIKDRMAQGEGEIFLGTSDVFDRPPVEILPVNEGYAGTQSQYATISCKMGYCFIDKQAGKVFVCKGRTLEEISNNGQYNFFKKYSQYPQKEVDNPFIGSGYVMAFDEQLSRLIICKNLTIPEDGDYSFTWSYCPDIKAWICLHDYFPHVLCYNRAGLYAVDNNKNKLFRHNSIISKAKYYDGVIKDSYIDYVHNDPPDSTKRYDSAKWITTVESNDVISEDETLTHLLVYTNSQCSGRIDLNAETGLWFGKDARNTEYTWNYNNFRDLVDNQTVVIVDDKGEFNSSNINNSKAWFEQSEFISKFAIFRLIYDNQSQKDIHINFVDTNHIKSDR